MWQGQKDSNPRDQFWRLRYYHYMMPLNQLVLYNINFKKERVFLKKVFTNRKKYSNIKLFPAGNKYSQMCSTHAKLGIPGFYCELNFRFILLRVKVYLAVFRPKTPIILNFYLILFLILLKI